MNRKNTRIYLFLLASCANFWVLKLNAQPQIYDEGIEYKLQAAKDIRLEGPLATFNTYTCDETLKVSLDDFADDELVGNTSRGMLSILNSPKNTVTQYNRKGEPVYLVMPAMGKGNIVCSRQSEKEHFYQTVLISERLRKGVFKKAQRREEGVIQGFMNWLLDQSTPTVEDDIASIFINLKYEGSLGSEETSSFSGDHSWRGDGELLKGSGVKKPYDSPVEPDIFSEHSISNQLLMADKYFGLSGHRGWLFGESLGLGVSTPKEDVVPEKKKTAYVSRTVPQGSLNERHIVMVAANTPQININIIQLALMFVGIPVSDSLDLSQLDIGEMNSAEIENFASIIHNLAESAPELIQEELLETAGENADTVVNLLLELESQLNSFGAIVSEWESDEHETPVLSLIRNNRRMLIGVALNEQLSGTQQILVPEGDELERSVLLDTLLGVMPTHSPLPLASDLGETIDLGEIDEMTLSVDSGDITLDQVERLRKKIASLINLFETGESDEQNRRKLVLHLQALTDALDRFEAQWGTTGTEDFSLEEQINHLKRKVIMFKRVLAVKEKELEESITGSALAQILQTRIEALTEKKNQALKLLRKHKRQQQTPDATPEQMDMHNGEDAGGAASGKSKPTEGKEKDHVKEKGSNEGNNEDSPEEGGNNGDDDSNGDDNRGDKGGDDGSEATSGDNEKELEYKRFELKVWIATLLGRHSQELDEEKLKQNCEQISGLLKNAGITLEEQNNIITQIIELINTDYPKHTHLLPKGENSEKTDLQPYLEVILRVMRSIPLAEIIIQNISIDKLEKAKKIASRFQEISVAEVSNTQSSQKSSYQAGASITSEASSDNPKWEISISQDDEDLMQNRREEVLQRVRESELSRMVMGEGEYREISFTQEEREAAENNGFNRDVVRLPLTVEYIPSSNRRAGRYILHDTKQLDEVIIERFPGGLVSEAHKANSALLETSRKNSVMDAVRLFFSDNPDMRTLLYKLIHQDTGNVFRSILFGGTDGDATDISFRPGLLHLGSRALDIRPTNAKQTDTNTLNIRLVILPNDRVKILYHIEFDRLSVSCAENYHTFDVNFSFDIELEFEAVKGKVYQKHSALTYKGKITDKKSYDKKLKELYEESKKDILLKFSTVDEAVEERLSRYSSDELSSEGYLTWRRNESTYISIRNTIDLLISRMRDVHKFQLKNNIKGYHEYKKLFELKGDLERVYTGFLEKESLSYEALDKALDEKIKELEDGSQLKIDFESIAQAHRDYREKVMKLSYEIEEVREKVEGIADDSDASVLVLKKELEAFIISAQELYEQYDGRGNNFPLPTMRRTIKDDELSNLILMYSPVSIIAKGVELEVVYLLEHVSNYLLPPIVVAEATPATQRTKLSIGSITGKVKSVFGFSSRSPLSSSKASSKDDVTAIGKEVTHSMLRQLSEVDKHPSLVLGTQWKHRVRRLSQSDGDLESSGKHNEDRTQPPLQQHSSSDRTGSLKFSDHESRVAVTLTQARPYFEIVKNHDKKVENLANDIDVIKKLKNKYDHSLLGMRQLMKDYFALGKGVDDFNKQVRTSTLIWQFDR